MRHDIVCPVQRNIRPVYNTKSIFLTTILIHKPDLYTSPPSAAEESTTAAAAGTAGIRDFTNSAQGYRLTVPASFESVGKAGADALFEDPGQRSTSVGVTVNPVKVSRIQEFGGLEDVGNRLLAAERNKVRRSIRLRYCHTNRCKACAEVATWRVVRSQGGCPVRASCGCASAAFFSPALVDACLLLLDGGCMRQRHWR